MQGRSQSSTGWRFPYRVRAAASTGLPAPGSPLVHSPSVSALPIYAGPANLCSHVAAQKLLDSASAIADGTFLAIPGVEQPQQP
jgi:hypothetical protein